LDFPENPPSLEVMKKQDPELLERYKLTQKYPVPGFPTIYFIRSSGKAFGKYGYDRGGPVHWTTMADRLVNPKTVSMRPLRFSSKTDGYPKYVSKNLYADNDFRGKKAPKLVVETWLTGKGPETDGKVVLIDFWATWCPSCRDLIPELGAWQKKFGKDLVVIGVSDEDKNTLVKFMKQTEMSYNVGTDTKETTEKVLGVKGIPQVLVITPDHIVRWQGYPGDDSDPLTEKVLSQIIETSKKQTLASRH